MEKRQIWNVGVEGAMASSLNISNRCINGIADKPFMFLVIHVKTSEQAYSHKMTT